LLDQPLHILAVRIRELMRFARRCEAADKAFGEFQFLGRVLGFGSLAARSS
jgi:hypothetical protein